MLTEELKEFFAENGKSKPENKEEFKPKSFRMSFDYEVKYPFPSILLDSQALIHPGEILTIVASPSVGKSNVCETLGVAHLRKHFAITESEIDTLGFQVHASAGRKGLLIDSERTRDDCRTGLERMKKRLGNVEGSILNNQFNGLDFLSFSGMTTNECKEELDHFLKVGNYGVVIIDGVLDFASSLNNEEDCLELVRNYLRVRAEKYELSLITTIHPNKGSENIAGHLGAFLYRWSRAVLLLRNHGNGIREITSDFVHGKLSKANNAVSHFYTWDEERSMFLSAEAPEKNDILFSRSVIETIFAEYLLAEKATQIPAATLKSMYATALGKSPRTAETHIRKAISAGLITPEGKGKATTYRLSHYDNTS